MKIVQLINLDFLSNCQMIWLFDNYSILKKYTRLKIKHLIPQRIRIRIKTQL